MVPSLKRPLRKMGKSDKKVDAQADRPGINTGVNYNRNFSFLQHKFRIHILKTKKWNEEKEPRYNTRENRKEIITIKGEMSSAVTWNPNIAALYPV